MQRRASAFSGHLLLYPTHACIYKVKAYLCAFRWGQLKTEKREVTRFYSTIHIYDSKIS